MGFIKIAAAILIFSSGLIGSYFIVNNSGPVAPTAGFGDEKLSNALNDLKNAGDLLVGKNPIQWSKESSDKPASVLNALNSPLALNSTSSDGKDGNLTKLVAGSIFSGMRQMDEGNKNPSEYFNPSNPSDPNSKKRWRWH